MKNLNCANAFDLLNGVKIFFDQINLIFMLPMKLKICKMNMKR